MYFNEDMIVRRVPKAIMKRTQENMEVYHMDLADSFEDAARMYAKKGTELWNAWYYNDFRKYIPSAYREECLDFEKYPLRYTNK